LEKADYRILQKLIFFHVLDGTIPTPTPPPPTLCDPPPYQWSPVGEIECGPSLPGNKYRLRHRCNYTCNSGMIINFGSFISYLLENIFGGT